MVTPIKKKIKKSLFFKLINLFIYLLLVQIIQFVL